MGARYAENLQAICLYINLADTAFLLPESLLDK
ncbi:hypothetical protein C8R32_10251 [Nitrosospira sp. Nsp5]|uniref:Uncharacterized protein n=1 Tax=Nitrosospira multiformis TaxID=1231 RepID=A0ABY0TND2_9PROT|nr:hypothetical protein C8R32_10251 [Nitrosospira sp. Nsp5]SDR00292.1 hypothetical protein SAMN05216402_3205 [Nitrosospira multiformis]